MLIDAINSKSLGWLQHFVMFKFDPEVYIHRTLSSWEDHEGEASTIFNTTCECGRNHCHKPLKWRHIHSRLAIFKLGVRIVKIYDSLFHKTLKLSRKVCLWTKEYLKVYQSSPCLSLMHFSQISMMQNIVKWSATTETPIDA